MTIIGDGGEGGCGSINNYHSSNIYMVSGTRLSAIPTLSHLICITIQSNGYHLHFTWEYTGTFLISRELASAGIFLVLGSLLPNKTALSILKQLWLKTFPHIEPKLSS